MANKRIGDAGEDIILLGAIGIGGYFLVNALTGLFNDDPQDKAAVQTQATLAPSANCFSFQYQPFVDNFNANIPTDVNGNPLTMQQFFIGVKAANDAGTPLLGVNGTNIAALGEALVSQLTGWFVATDQNAVLGIFAPFYNQTQVSSLAAYLYYNYGYDLLTLLQGSLFKPGLTTANLAQLIQKMNTLPS